MGQPILFEYPENLDESQRRRLRRTILAAIDDARGWGASGISSRCIPPSMAHAMNSNAQVPIATDSEKAERQAEATLRAAAWNQWVESPPLAKLKKFRPEVFALIERMAAVQTKKAHGYASEEDCFSNYEEAGVQVGLPGWLYVEARLAEKQERMKQQIAKGNMDGTSAENAEELAVDRANLVLISCVMYRRDQQKGTL